MKNESEINEVSKITAAENLSKPMLYLTEIIITKTTNAVTIELLWLYRIYMYIHSRVYITLDVLELNIYLKSGPKRQIRICKNNLNSIIQIPAYGMEWNWG